MNALRRMAAVAEKEVMHILRDPQVLLFALGMPLTLLLLFGYAVSFDVDNIALVVVDQDDTAESRALSEAFVASSLFVRVATVRDPAEVDPLLRKGLASAAVVIPPGYARRLQRDEEGVAQLLVDGADNTTAAIALGYANAIALTASLSRAQALRGEVALPVSARVRTLFNPGLRSAVFLVPGLMVVILVMVAVMLTALTIAREYERGSMEQLFATPVGRMEIVIGKLGPYFLLGLLQVLLVLVLGVVLFDVPIAGSLLTLALVASVFLAAMLMQGLVVSAITKNQMVASQIAVISTMLPALLLSGFVFPVDNMPKVLQVIAHILPAKYLVDALRAILLRGNGLDVVWVDIAAIGGFAVLMLVVASKRFKRSLA